MQRDTQVEPAVSAKAKQATLILKTIGSYGLHGGVTCDALEVELELTHQAASARVSELAKAGRIVDVGLRGVTRSGRKAIAWVVKEDAENYQGAAGA